MMVRPRTSTDTIRKMGKSGDLRKQSQYDSSRCSKPINNRLQVTNLPYNSMADQLYLSYWLRKHTGQNMLRNYETALKLFPFSLLAQSPSTFKAIPLDYAEPAVLEVAFPPP